MKIRNSTPPPCEAALRRLVSGEGIYWIGIASPDDPWAQECMFRRDYAQAVLDGEDPDIAWERVKREAAVHSWEATVRGLVAAGVSEEKARAFLAGGAS